MRVVRVHVDDALNQSIKSENIITSQFDVTTETTVNEKSQQSVFLYRKESDCEVVFLGKNVSFDCVFFCQCLKNGKRKWLALSEQKLESPKTQNKSRSSDWCRH